MLRFSGSNAMLSMGNGVAGQSSGFKRIVLGDLSPGLEHISIYRTSDYEGLTIATHQTNLSYPKAYPILTLTSTDNADSCSTAQSATMDDLLLLKWCSKQGTGATYANQIHRLSFDIGSTRNYKSGTTSCFGIASSSDAICLNTAGTNAYPNGASLYVISDTINKLLYNTNTPYTNASYGTANFTCNGDMFIKSNNAFNDGSTGWNMHLCMSNGNASELLFAFQMDNGPVSTSTTSIAMGTVSGNDLRMMTANSTRMTITSTGRVGIGTTTPLYGLHVMTTATVTIDGGGSGVAYFKTSGGLVSTAGPLSSVAVGIACSGSVVASTGVYCWSDERIKRDWAELSDDVADSMLKIKPKLYRYKTDPDSASLQVGYSAQDLLRAGLPHCDNFHQSEGMKVEDPQPDMEGISYSVEYSKMSCLLHKLVLRQQKEIDELRSKLNELKAVIFE